MIWRFYSNIERFMNKTILEEYDGILDSKLKIKFTNPRLFIMCGIPGSGKSTIAKYLEDNYGCVRISTDEIKLIFISKTLTYTLTDLFALQYFLIEKYLSSNYHVVADSNSDKEDFRNQLKQIATMACASSITIYCNTSLKTAYARMLERLKKNTQIKNFYVSYEKLSQYFASLEPPIESMQINTELLSLEESYKKIDLLFINRK